MRRSPATAFGAVGLLAALASGLAGSPSAVLSAAGDGDGAGVRSFAPELDSADEHSSPGAFADGGATLYLTRSARDFSRSRLFVARRSGPGWGAPAPLFDAGHTDAGPALSPDGTRLYFHSNRSTGIDGVADEWNLFVAERDAGGAWSAPSALSAPLNTSKAECCLAPAPDGSLLFASDRHGSWDIWRAWPDGGSWRLDKLPEGINTSYMEWPSSVDLVRTASGEVERLLFSSIRRGGAGGDDLYVAFRESGAWLEPRSLGAGVNTPGYEDSPRIAPDGSLVFAARAESGVSTIRSASAGVATAPGPQRDEDVEAALTAADMALGRAWSARDLDAYLVFFAPEARATWSGEPARGRAAIRAQAARDFADPGYAIDGRELGRWVSGSGDLAVLYGVSTIFRGTGAARTSASGNWSLVWRRIDGEWRIVLESFVADPPANPAPAP